MSSTTPSNTDVELSKADQELKDRDSISVNHVHRPTPIEAINVDPSLQVGATMIMKLDTSPSLATIPTHVIQEIAFQADQKTTWRMMATCRTVRDGAERALRSHLAELKILLKVKGVEDDQYSHNPIMPGPQSIVDYTPISEAYRLAESRFDVYPLAKSFIRKLTIGIQSGYPHLGWPLVRELAPQLQQLKIHFTNYTGLHHYDHQRDGIAMNLNQGRDPSLPNSLQFPHLSHLTIMSHNQGARQLLSLSYYLVTLVHLSITCFDKGRSRREYADADLTPMKRLDSLETLAADSEVSLGEKQYIQLSTTVSLSSLTDIADICIRLTRAEVESSV